MQCDYPAASLQAGIEAINLLTETGIFPSKGEARKMIQNGGVSINRKKLEDAQQKIDASLLLHGKFILVQKGKKNYFLVRAV